MERKHFGIMLFLVGSIGYLILSLYLSMNQFEYNKAPVEITDEGVLCSAMNCWFRTSFFALWELWGSSFACTKLIFARKSNG
jgi:hypothetical protein